MSSAPFGNHPTLAHYLQWATKQGCTIRYGFNHDFGGLPHEKIEVVAPGNKHWVVISGVQVGERLAPSMVAYYDRRLGMVSGFASLEGPQTD